MHYPIGEPEEHDETEISRFLRRLQGEEGPVNIFDPPAGFGIDPTIVTKTVFDQFAGTRVERDFTSLAIKTDYNDEDIDQQIRNELATRAANTKARAARRQRNPDDPTSLALGFLSSGTDPEGFQRNIASRGFIFQEQERQNLNAAGLDSGLAITNPGHQGRRTSQLNYIKLRKSQMSAASKDLEYRLKSRGAPGINSLGEPIAGLSLELSELIDPLLDRFLHPANGEGVGPLGPKILALNIRRQLPPDLLPEVDAAIQNITASVIAEQSRGGPLSRAIAPLASGLMEVLTVIENLGAAASGVALTIKDNQGSIPAGALSIGWDIITDGPVDTFEGLKELTNSQHPIVREILVGVFDVTNLIGGSWVMRKLAGEIVQFTLKETAQSALRLAAPGHLDMVRALEHGPVPGVSMLPPGTVDTLFMSAYPDAGFPARVIEQMSHAVASGKVNRGEVADAWAQSIADNSLPTHLFGVRDPRLREAVANQRAGLQLSGDPGVHQRVQAEDIVRASGMSTNEITLAALDRNEAIRIVDDVHTHVNEMYTEGVTGNSPDAFVPLVSGGQADLPRIPIDPDQVAREAEKGNVIIDLGERTHLTITRENAERQVDDLTDQIDNFTDGGALSDADLPPVAFVDDADGAREGFVIRAIREELDSRLLLLNEQRNRIREAIDRQTLAQAAPPHPVVHLGDEGIPVGGATISRDPGQRPIFRHLTAVGMIEEAMVNALPFQLRAAMIAGHLPGPVSRRVLEATQNSVGLKASLVEVSFARSPAVRRAFEHVRVGVTAPNHPVNIILTRHDQRKRAADAMTALTGEFATALFDRGNLFGRATFGHDAPFRRASEDNASDGFLRVDLDASGITQNTPLPVRSGINTRPTWKEGPDGQMIPGADVDEFKQVEGNPFFGDLVEHRDFYDLSPQQNEAIDRLIRRLDAVRENENIFGVHRFGEELTGAQFSPNGSYFPRVPAAARSKMNPDDLVIPPDDADNVLSAISEDVRAFQQPRQHLTMEEGFEAGVFYADPVEAVKRRSSSGLDAALDGELIAALRQFGVTPMQRTMNNKGGREAFDAMERLRFTIPETRARGAAALRLVEREREVFATAVRDLKEVESGKVYTDEHKGVRSEAVRLMSDPSIIDDAKTAAKLRDDLMSLRADVSSALDELGLEVSPGTRGTLLNEKFSLEQMLWTLDNEVLNNPARLLDDEGMENLFSYQDGLYKSLIDQFNFTARAVESASAVENAAEAELRDVTALLRSQKEDFAIAKERFETVLSQQSSGRLTPGTPAEFADTPGAPRLASETSLQSPATGPLSNTMFPTRGVNKQLLPSDQPVNTANLIGTRTSDQTSRIPDAVQTAFQVGIFPLINLARFTSATADFSILGVQFGMSMFNNPAKAMTAMGRSLGSLASPEVYYRHLAEHADSLDRFIVNGGVVASALDQGDFVLSNKGLTGFLQRPTIKGAPGIVNTVTGNNPVSALARGSNITFSRAGNIMRLSLWEAAETSAQIRGVDLVGTKLGRDLAQTINNVTGTSGASASSMEQLLVFAPRFFRAQLNLLKTAATRDLGLPGAELGIGAGRGRAGPAALNVPFPIQSAASAPSAGAMARRNIAQFVGLAAGMTVLINNELGEETDFNPLSSNFLRIRAFGQDISLLGSWNSLFRLFSHGGEDFVEGDLFAPAIGFEAGRGSPVSSAFVSTMRGQTMTGDTLKFNTPGQILNSFTRMARNGFVPFSAQGTLEDGFKPGALLGFFGLASTVMTLRERLQVANNDAVAALGVFTVPGEDPRAYSTYAELEEVAGTPLAERLVERDPTARALREELDLSLEQRVAAGNDQIASFIHEGRLITKWTDKEYAEHSAEWEQNGGLFDANAGAIYRERRQTVLDGAATAWTLRDQKYPDVIAGFQDSPILINQLTREFVEGMVRIIDQREENPNGYDTLDPNNRGLSALDIFERDFRLEWGESNWAKIEAVLNLPPSTPAEVARRAAVDRIVNSDREVTIDWSGGSTPPGPIGFQPIESDYWGAEENLWHELQAFVTSAGDPLYPEIQGMTYREFILDLAKNETDSLNATIAQIQVDGTQKLFAPGARTPLDTPLQPGTLNSPQAHRVRGNKIVLMMEGLKTDLRQQLIYHDIEDGGTLYADLINWGYIREPSDKMLGDLAIQQERLLQRVEMIGPKDFVPNPLAPPIAPPSILQAPRELTGNLEEFEALHTLYKESDGKEGASYAAIGIRVGMSPEAVRSQIRRFRDE
jgi:hypothetical protein